MDNGVFTELFTASSGSLTWTDYVFAGSEMIGIHVTPATGSASNRFFIHDHLNSVSIITGDIGCSGLTLGGSNGCLVERDSYDAWGKRRNAITWADDTTDSLRSVCGGTNLNDGSATRSGRRLRMPRIFSRLSKWWVSWLYGSIHS